MINTGRIVDPHSGQPINQPTEESEVPVEERPAQLPDPVGYKILCAVPEVERMFESGLLKADKTMEHEEILTTVLFVVKLGPECYADKTRFPSGPWCKEGDFILIRPNIGTRVTIHGKKFRLINDDAVEAVVENPAGVMRG